MTGLGFASRAPPGGHHISVVGIGVDSHHIGGLMIHLDWTRRRVAAVAALAVACGGSAGPKGDTGPLGPPGTGGESLGPADFSPDVSGSSSTPTVVTVTFTPAGGSGGVSAHAWNMPAFSALTATVTVP